MNTITKTVQRSEDLFVQFSNEELSQLGMKEGDKFTCEIDGNGVVLKKFATIDIDISDFSREILEFLIIDSVEKDISVNEVITNIIEDQLNKID
jgi:hypothetical protein